MRRELKRLVHWARRRSLFTLARATALVSQFEPGSVAYGAFHKHGFHLLRQHYYLPIPDANDVGGDYRERESAMVGVNMNEAKALHLLTHVFPARMDEFRAQFPLHQSIGMNGFYLFNGYYMAIDAHIYYAFIRHLRPARIVEIGGGFSTMLAGAACLQNQKEYGDLPRLTAIEPYPTPSLKAGFGGLSEVLERKVQDVPLDFFTSLTANDILFIDSSHVLREGGDVLFEICEILPRLATGVVVHIHDISLPRPYPRVYFEQHLYWSEQYLLQAFLAFNSRFEVLWAGNYMMLRHPEQLTAVFPEYHAMRAMFPSAQPAAFWMRVKD